MNDPSIIEVFEETNTILLMYGLDYVTCVDGRISKIELSPITSKFRITIDIGRKVCARIVVCADLIRKH